MTTPTTTAPLPAVGDPDVAVEVPTAYRPYTAGPDIDVLPAYLPVPGMGVLPANSYLIHGTEPVLVDAGTGGAADGYAAALSSVIDPAEIRWLWLTHTDPDHIGGLGWLLDAAPDMRIITTYLAVGKMGLHQPLPMDRLWWCNPGDHVRAGDRDLVAMRPPSFDAPETTALHDPRSGTLFSADSFGALLSAPAVTADEVASADLEEGLVLWSTIDSPWLNRVDRRAFDQSLRAVDQLGVTRVLSAHLPPATAMTSDLLRWMSRVPDADPWVGPDQAALEEILAQVQA
jgi:glyoxylase-like metal-dependent hydrolase (beta-lactamase superfamily II)